jgi:DNA-binding NarL/FixJ family response regulator
MVAVAAVRARSAAAMTERPWASAEARQANLTEREWEVLEILVTGASTREISAQLCISPRTVTNHLASIYGKLGTHTRTQAVARALGLSKKNGHS